VFPKERDCRPYPPPIKVHPARETPVQTAAHRCIDQGLPAPEDGVPLNVISALARMTTLSTVVEHGLSRSDRAHHSSGSGHEHPQRTDDFHAPVPHRRSRYAQPRSSANTHDVIQNYGDPRLRYRVRVRCVKEFSSGIFSSNFLSCGEWPPSRREKW